MNIPKDPVILLSFINTRLRDFYSSLEELCDDLEIEGEDIIKCLETIGYYYSETKNQFL